MTALSVKVITQSSMPYACILAISNSWSIKLKTLKKSVIRIPLKPLLSKNLRNFSIKEVWYNKNLFHEISLSFPELFIIRKYVQIGFKNKGSPYFFLRSRGQKMKILQKLNKRDCFCLHSRFNFLWRFSKNLIYKINIWFNFAFGSFFE